MSEENVWNSGVGVGVKRGVGVERGVEVGRIVFEEAAGVAEGTSEIFGVSIWA